MTKQEIQAEIDKLTADLNKFNPFITDPRVKRLSELYRQLCEAKA